jgi:hypothetical protein
MPSALSPIASLLLAAISASAPVRSSATATATGPSSGQVRFVTAKRIYLDKGAADGVRAGDRVAFSRQGRAAGGCVIDLVGAHDAVCRGRGALVGDAFAAPRRPAPVSPPVPAPLPPPEPDEALVRRAAELAASPHDKVDFVPQARAVVGATGTAGLGVAVYATRPGSPQYVGETLDVALHHVPLGSSGFRFDTAFSVVRMQTTSPPRFPASGTEFYLWDAEISRREIDSQTVLALGRIWPWHTPGLPILDGLQLGRRNETGTVEGGAYAGLIPETLTLAPTFDAWTTGLYGALSQPGGRDDAIRMAAEEARLAIRHSPTVGWVREAQGQATLELAGGGIAASGALRDAPEVDRQPVLELVNGEAWLRSASVAARVQVRYLGVAPELEPLLRDELPRVLGGFHGSVALAWDPARTVGVAVNGDAHHEQDGDLNEVNAGLDLHFPRLFGASGGLWLGASAGQGWMESRSAYAQVILTGPRIRFVGRLGGDVTRFADPVGEVALTELGGSLQLEGRLTPRLRVVARSLVRVPLAITGVLLDATSGTVSSLDLVAAY